MISPDTSVLIAGFVPTHPFHSRAARRLAAVRRDGRLVAHTLAETYAVLTAPGGPYRAGPEAVVDYLEQFLGRPPAALSGSAYADHVRRLSRLALAGGAVYDALIALTATDAGATLVSLDRRAARSYRACGVEAELLD